MGPPPTNSKMNLNKVHPLVQSSGPRIALFLQMQHRKLDHVDPSKIEPFPSNFCRNETATSTHPPQYGFEGIPWYRLPTSPTHGVWCFGRRKQGVVPDASFDDQQFLMACSSPMTSPTLQKKRCGPWSWICNIITFATLSGLSKNLSTATRKTWLHPSLISLSALDLMQVRTNQQSSHDVPVSNSSNEKYRATSFPSFLGFITLPGTISSEYIARRPFWSILFGCFTNCPEKNLANDGTWATKWPNKTNGLTIQISGFPQIPSQCWLKWKYQIEVLHPSPSWYSICLWPLASRFPW